VTTELSAAAALEIGSVAPAAQEAAVPAPLRRLPPIPWRDPHSVPPGLLKKYIGDLEKACELEPSSAGLRTCLGMAYAMNYQVYKSMDALETAIAAEPAHFFARFKYAELHYRLRALIKAEAETQRALELAETPWEFTLARRQLQEIRTLMRAGTQKPEWTKSLRLPVLILMAMAVVLCLIVYGR
jgi:tetratricopeptide (TPR) repeat protein